MDYDKMSNEQLLEAYDKASSELGKYYYGGGPRIEGKLEELRNKKAEIRAKLMWRFNK